MSSSSATTAPRSASLGCAPTLPASPASPRRGRSTRRSGSRRCASSRPRSGAIPAPASSLMRSAPSSRMAAANAWSRGSPPTIRRRGAACASVADRRRARACTVRAASAGSWGNGLEVLLAASWRAETLARDPPPGGPALAVDATEGFAAGALVRLSQPGKPDLYRVVALADAAARDALFRPSRSGAAAADRSGAPGAGSGPAGAHRAAGARPFGPARRPPARRLSGPRPGRRRGRLYRRRAAPAPARYGGPLRGGAAAGGGRGRRNRRRRGAAAAGARAAGWR